MSDYGYCQLCAPPRKVELEVLLDHLRIVHDRVFEPETWPDGELVVIDQTLEPRDFAE